MASTEYVKPSGMRFLCGGGFEPFQGDSGFGVPTAGVKPGRFGNLPPLVWMD